MALVFGYQKRSSPAPALDTLGTTISCHVAHVGSPFKYFQALGPRFLRDVPSVCASPSSLPRTVSAKYARCLHFRGTYKNFAWALSFFLFLFFLSSGHFRFRGPKNARLFRRPRDLPKTPSWVALCIAFRHSFAQLIMNARSLGEPTSPTHFRVNGRLLSLALSAVYQYGQNAADFNVLVHPCG